MYTQSVMFALRIKARSPVMFIQIRFSFVFIRAPEVKQDLEKQTRQIHGVSDCPDGHFKINIPHQKVQSVDSCHFEVGEFYDKQDQCQKQRVCGF